MNLLPKQDFFYTLFNQYAVLTNEAAEHLAEALPKGRASVEKVAVEMKVYEGRADRLGMELFDRLHKSFITPFDSEDIFALIHNIDDIMDSMEDVSHRLSSYNIDPIPPTMIKLANVISDATKSLVVLMVAFEKKKDVIANCKILDQYEEQIDQITRQAISDLFKFEKDPITLIKHKEAYEYFEACGDAFAHVATVLGRIQVKGG